MQHYEKFGRNLRHVSPEATVKLEILLSDPEKNLVKSLLKEEHRSLLYPSYHFFSYNLLVKLIS